MSDAISIPAGAFAAAKASATPAKAEVAPKTILRKPEPAPLPQEAKPEAKTEAQPEPPKDMTAAEKKIWKLKADGEEFEFDASDEEAIKREIMRARGSDKRFKESAAMRQQAETFLQMLRDPEERVKVLSDPRIGVDVKQWAMDIVWKQIQEDQLTPEQKAQRDKDRDYERLKKDEDDTKAAKEAETKRERAVKYESQYEKTILKALEIKGVPKDQKTVMRMAEYMLAAVDKGVDIEPEEIAKLVKQDNSYYLKTHIEDMTDDQLREFVGDKIADRLRQADLKRLKSPTANPFPERYPRPDKKPQESPKRQSSDWRKATMDEFLARK